MHRLEPARDHVGVGAEGDATIAAHLDDDIAASDAINEAGGDDLAANGHAVEGHSVAFFGGGDHCEVRHFFFDASGQFRNFPSRDCDTADRDIDNGVRPEGHFNAMTLAISNTATNNRRTVQRFEFGGAHACGRREGKNRQHAVAMMHLGFRIDSGEIGTAIIADNAADHELLEQLAHGSGTLARYGMGLAGDLGEAGGEVLKAVNHLNNSLFDDLNIRDPVRDCNTFFRFFALFYRLISRT